MIDPNTIPAELPEERVNCTGLGRALAGYLVTMALILGFIAAAIYFK
jgi:hypothetical protein